MNLKVFTKKRMYQHWNITIGIKRLEDMYF
nr:MAG TPA: hypothetical protein [Caudoviricetes sp.]